MSNFYDSGHYWGIMFNLKPFTMEPRINFFEKGQNAMKALYGLGMYLSKSPLEPKLLHLIYYRVSQVNGCAYCLDMHSKDALNTGESLQRLLVLDAWAETTFYTDRERAAFAWAEEITRLSGPVKEATYKQVLAHFTEEELVDLTVAVIAINSYNRINLAFPDPAKVGTYLPGIHKPVSKPAEV